PRPLPPAAPPGSRAKLYRRDAARPPAAPDARGCCAPATTLRRGDAIGATGGETAPPAAKFNVGGGVERGERVHQPPPSSRSPSISTSDRPLPCGCRSGAF